MLRSTRRVPASTSPEAQEAPECCTPFSDSFRHWVRPLSFNTTCMLVEYADHSFSTLMFPHGLQRKPSPTGRFLMRRGPAPRPAPDPSNRALKSGFASKDERSKRMLPCLKERKETARDVVL